MYPNNSHRTLNNTITSGITLATPSLPFGLLVLSSIAPAPILSSTTATITIQPSDTLSKIAKAHNVGICDVAEANAIEDPDLIIAGQTLVIPAETGEKDDKSCLSD